MNALDLVVIGIVLFSGLFAFTRGFVKEALSVATWVGAGLAALYLLPVLEPVAERFVPKGTIADVTTGVVIFVVALVVFSVISSAISSRVKDSALSALDRTLGLVFGILRGVIIACLGYLALAWALPADQPQPNWLSQARALPYLKSGAEALRSFVPESLLQRGTQRAQETQRAVETANQLRSLISPPQPATAPAKSSAPPAETENMRKGMNQLMQQNTR